MVRQASGKCLTDRISSQESDVSGQGDGLIELPLDTLLLETDLSSDKPNIQQTEAVDMSGRATRQSTGATKGKLKKLASRTGIPASSGRSLRSQRPLGPALARPDTYALDESPEKPVLKPKNRLQEPPQPSPLRAQRKEQRQETQHKPAGADVEPEPLQDADNSPDEIVVRSPRESPARQKRQDAAEEMTDLSNANATAASGDSANQEAPQQTSVDEEDEEDLFVQSSEGQEDPELPANPMLAVNKGMDVPTIAGAERTPIRSKGKLVPVKIRGSELYSPMKDAADDEGERSEARVQAPSRLKLKPKKKRQREPSEPGMPRPKKRQSTVPEAPVDDIVDNTELPERQADDRRLLDQMAAINNLVHATKRVGRGTKDGETVFHDIYLEDPEVKSIYKLCNHASDKFTQMIQGSDEGPLVDPPSELNRIAERVLQLCGRDSDFRPDFEDQTKSQNIYFHLIPRLVRLLRRMAECYIAIDEDEETGDVSVTLHHLGVLTQFVALILEIGAAASKYARPDTSLSIVLPVKTMLIRPLKSIAAVFRRRMDLIKENEERARLRALEDEAQAQQQLHEEEEAVQKARIEQLRLRWSRLHEERRWVEPGIIPLWKQKHLRIPEPMPEMDQNGEEFERIQLFGHRVGAPPVLVEAAWNQHWTDEEISALYLGLREYSGPSVFPRIFRRFCVRKGVLNKYNVTEIVTMAARLKQHESRHQLDENGFVEEWVEAIPEWTRPHLLLGKENDAEGRSAA